MGVWNQGKVGAEKRGVKGIGIRTTGLLRGGGLWKGLESRKRRESKEKTTGGWVPSHLRSKGRKNRLATKKSK